MSDVPSRMLKETLRGRLAPPSSECLEADVLAAWSDGTLNRRERATVESHAATCSRCQAMLAAMAKIASPQPSPRWWQTSTVRWLVPIATMSAVAVAVWMNVPAERPATPASQFARTASPPPAPVSETPPVVAAPAAKATGALDRLSDAKAREPQTARTTQPAPRVDSVAVPSAAAETAASSVDQREPASAPTLRAKDGSLRSEAFRAVTEPATIAREQSIADRQSAIEIPSPDRSVRWRIVGGTIVERSTAGGTAWQAQATGATTRLTAGAAPSPTICWLVGLGGTVLVTKDGRAWQRVVFPEAVDLSAIRAADGSSATVTTADGRAFTTADGGNTWR